MDQSLCALDTQRFITKSWAQRVKANLANCHTHATFICFFVCPLSPLCLCYMCVCVWTMLCIKLRGDTCLWGLWPNMVLFRPCYSYLAVFWLQGSKVNCNRLTRWSRLCASVCVWLLLCVITEWKEKCCPVRGELNMWKQGNARHQAGIYWWRRQKQKPKRDF